MDDSQTRAITVALEHLGYEMVPTDVLITDLVPDIPAAEVLEIGDSVDSFNGTEIVRSTDLTDLLEGLEPGDVVDVGVTRDGSPQTLEVELAEAGRSRGRGHDRNHGRGVERASVPAFHRGGRRGRAICGDDAFSGHH